MFVLAGLWLGSRNKSSCRAAQYEMGKALLPAQVTELCHGVTPARARSAPAEGREQSAQTRDICKQLWLYCREGAIGYCISSPLCVISPFSIPLV